MRLFWNLLLALFWASLWGTLSLNFLVTGFISGYVVLMALERANIIENKFYGRKFWRLIKFTMFFFKELWVSNLAVATDVLRFNPRYCPAIVKIPLDLKEDGQIALLANVITLTPGTLTLDVSDDKKFIYVHAMFLDPKERQAFVDSIKVGFENKIRELFET